MIGVWGVYEQSFLGFGAYLDGSRRSWRKLVLSEDDPRRPGWPHPAGGYRLFRFPNVIPIEHWRRPVSQTVIGRTNLTSQAHTR
jgi:hypothetical protein